MTDLERHQLRRWQAIRLKLCLSCPIIAPALAVLQLCVMVGGRGNKLGHVAVDARGNVYIDTVWSAQQTDGTVAFAVLHETLHLLLRHHDRRHNRQPQLWNIAADFVINEVVDKLSDDSVRPIRPDFALWRARDAPTMAEGLSTEDVYAYLLKSATWVNASGDVGAGCGVAVGDADDEQWQAIADSVAKMAQNDMQLRTLFQRPVRPVSWSSLVRRTISATVSRAACVTTWSRVDRRSPPGIILPGRTGGARRIAVAIDKSGSMSDQDVAVAVAQTAAIARAAGVAAFVVIHDDAVHAELWIRPKTPPAEIAKYITSRGGTLFAPAYAAVEQQLGKFDAFIHFTDGAPCDPWPAAPRNCKQAVAALTPCGAAAPASWRTIVVAAPG